MSRIFFSTLFFLFLSNHLLGQISSKEATLLKLEKEWTMLLDKGDTSALKNIWTENYVVNNAAGKIVSVKDILNLMKSGHIFPKVERQVEKITFNGPLAIVMGSEVQYSNDGTEKQRRFTNVWTETKDGWKLVARQATSND